MRTSAVLAIAAGSLLSQVSALIYTTAPVATTSWTANQPATVEWADDGNTPTLATIGACSIDLCTGGVTQQTCLQNIAPSLDVSTNAQVSFTPNPAIGASGDVYFIKYTSIGLMDPTSPQYHYTAYSAKFTLLGMTGTFNATVLAEISAASAAPASTPAAAATTAAAAATTPASATGAKTSASASKASSSAQASGTSKASGATRLAGSFAGAPVVASLVGLAFGAVAFAL